MPGHPTPQGRGTLTYQLCSGSLQPQLCCCHLPRAQLVLQPLHLDAVQVPLLIPNPQEEQGQASGALGTLQGTQRGLCNKEEK